MTSSVRSKFNCWICNKPVDLETTKTDDRGNAVHEECYVMVCALKRNSPQADEPSVS